MTKRTDTTKVLPILIPVLGEELALAIIELRDVVKKEPMTEYAAKLQAKEYLKTGDPVAAAEMQILRSWVAIRSDWFFNEIAKDKRRTSTVINRPMSAFAAAQHEIKQQLERTVYGERNEFAGSTLDLTTRDYRPH